MLLRGGLFPAPGGTLHEGKQAEAILLLGGLFPAPGGALHEGRQAEAMLLRGRLCSAAADGALPVSAGVGSVLRREGWAAAPVDGRRHGSSGGIAARRRRRRPASSGGARLGGRRIGHNARLGSGLPAMRARSGRLLRRQVCPAAMIEGLIGYGRIARCAASASSSAAHVLIPSRCSSGCLFPCHLNPFCCSSQAKDVLFAGQTHAFMTSLCSKAIWLHVCAQWAAPILPISRQCQAPCACHLAPQAV